MEFDRKKVVGQETDGHDWRFNCRASVDRERLEMKRENEVCRQASYIGIRDEPNIDCYVYDMEGSAR